MSNFFEAARGCEAGKQRPKFEQNTALLRLPVSSPSLIQNSTYFTAVSSKRNVGDARQYFTLPKLSPNISKQDEMLTSYATVVDFTAVPDSITAKQQAHRDALTNSKVQLQRCEDKDADDIARRAKAKRLEADRLQRVRRIAAGLQDMSTIDYEDDKDLPASKLRSKVLGVGYHPQNKNNVLTATTAADDTISDHSNLRPPAMAYATEAIYGTPIHSIMNEASTARALEGQDGTARSNGQLRAILLHQQQIAGAQEQVPKMSPGEAAAVGAHQYLRSKYGPSMLWPLGDANGAQTGVPRRLQNQSASRHAEILLSREMEN